MSVPRGPTALLVIGLAQLVVTMSLVPVLDRGFFLAYGYSLVWLITGYIAARVRPSTRLGTLMMVLAVVDMIGSAGNAGYGTSLGFEVLRTAAILITFTQPALLVHMGLTYPTGRATDRTTRVTLRVVWAVMATYAVAVLLTTRPPAEFARCADRACTDVLFHIVESEAVRDWIRVVGGLAVAVVFVLSAVVLVQRWWRSSPRVRRLRVLPVAVMALASGFAAIATAFNAVQGLTMFNGPFFGSLLISSLLAIPAVFLAGLVRERLDLARVSDLVRRLGASLSPDELQPALAAALGDPRLNLTLGTDVTLPAEPSGRTATPIGDPTAPAAVLVHDASLLDEPRLLDAVSAAVALALDNARLQSELREQLAEVRASRARLVHAGDTARRRLERDLHDGAQQRLIAAGLALQAARTQRSGRPADDSDDLIRNAEDEVRAAIQDLRELARGIHPAVLTELGLSAAVAQLTRRQPFPVQVRGGELPRLAPAIEATAYFVVGEALTNVGKHAHASAAEVAFELTDDVLTVQVNDDGVGGATPSAGSGLAGLADRVAAVEGTIQIDSPVGSGTVVRVVLPNR